MIHLQKIPNYIVVKNSRELREAKQCNLCRFIIRETGNVIHIWSQLKNKWTHEKYVIFGEDKQRDEEATGLKAYLSFYYYCGKEEVEKMKKIYKPIPKWESYEQLHYFNIDFVDEKIYKPIYEFDANSAFTYGALQLPKGFELLKEYMLLLFDKKKNAANKILRSRYKNLQNFLIGYFARIVEFVKVRSEIIRESNLNIMKKMAEISNVKGIVYLSNTDSIVTDTKGAEIMKKYLGENVGQFKISSKVDRLYYKSSNIYQLGDDIKYSGVSYFARKNTDFFKDNFASQSGSLIEPFDFILDTEPEYTKLCRVRFGEIHVEVTNKIGETIKKLIYKIGD